MNYHFTKSEYLQNILKKGLNPQVGENSEKVHDTRKNQNSKLCFSQGFEGEILMSAYFFMRYTYDKSTGVQDFDKFMKPYNILLAFDENLVENEDDNIADAHTTKSIDASDIKIAKLQNVKTGENIYDREEIVKYMMSQIPVETFAELDESKVGRKLEETKYFSYLADEDKELSEKSTMYFIKEFYEKYAKDIEKYKNGNYNLEYQDLQKYMELTKTSKTNMKKLIVQLAKSKEVAMENQNADEIFQEIENTQVLQKDDLEK